MGVCLLFIKSINTNIYRQSMLLFIAEKKQDRTKNVELNKKYNPLGT